MNNETNLDETFFQVKWNHLAWSAAKNVLLDNFEQTKARQKVRQKKLKWSKDVIMEEKKIKEGMVCTYNTTPFTELEFLIVV